MTSEVIPVLPPTFTPAALSTYEVTVEVPIRAPATVDTLSDSIALSMSLIFPSEPTFPATFATLVNVPAVSKKSIKNNVKITVTIDALSAAPKSKVIRCVIGGGEETTPLKFPNPVIQAIAL